MATVQFYNKRNITYDSCYNYASIINNGFRDDLIFRVFNPLYFGPDAIAEPELSRQLAAFSRWGARYAMRRVIKGEMQLFFIYNGDTPVATCTCILPIYKRVPLSMLEQIKLKIYEIYCVFADYWDGQPAKKLFTPERIEFFNQLYHGAGSGDNSPEAIAKLAKMSSQELASALYPSDQTVYIEMLGVTYNQQGRGYRSQIIQAVLDHYKGIEGPEFSIENTVTPAPAMISLYPSNAHDTFYTRFGFKTRSTNTAVLPNGKVFEHKYMQRALD